MISSKQRKLCMKCCLLSPKCFVVDRVLCYGDKHRDFFVRINGFAPLPENERYEDERVYEM